ncbi:hypothetical protein F4604DRAFT_1688995 [Suillus subluteus]|nr:hypothetical protein F4604DRAFT_1688995 [Suillus subluteus]
MPTPVGMYFLQRQNRSLRVSLPSRLKLAKTWGSIQISIHSLLALLDGCEDADPALYPDDSSYKASLIPMPSGNLHPTAPGAEFSLYKFHPSQFRFTGERYKKGDEEEVETHQAFSRYRLFVLSRKFPPPPQVLQKSWSYMVKGYPHMTTKLLGLFGFVKLWDIFEGCTQILGPERMALMDQLLSMFFQMIQKHSADNAPAPSVAFSQVKVIPAKISAAITDSKAQQNEIAVAQYLGELAYHNAEWIGCDRVHKDIATTLRNKTVVESQEILDLGISTNAFKLEDIILVDGGWMRIQKPTNGKCRSVILWAKDHVNDTVPTEAKIFGAALYNAQEETSFASEYTQERVQLEMHAMMHDIQTRENCKRGMMNYGTLVKCSLGMAVTNGLLNQPEIQVAKIHENARTRTIAKHQACNFAFLQGFLPHFAKEQLVLDDESNFVYAEFKVILDLDVDTHFIWNAPNDLHGTTMNRVFSKQPKSWKTFTQSLANVDLAQWSQANVLTHKAVSSGLRGGGNQQGDE